MENTEIQVNPSSMPEAAVQAPKKKRRLKVSPAKIIIFCVLLLYAFALFFPLYTVFISSFTSLNEIRKTVNFVWFPKNFTFTAYKIIFTEDIYLDRLGAPSIVIGLLNTIWMTLVPLVTGLVVSGLSAFAYSKIKFPGRDRLFRFAFIITTVPLGAFSIISYTFYSLIHWVGTPLPIIVPGLFGSMGTVFFLKMYYEGIPDSIIEAARIDGLSAVGTFFRMVFPLAIPAFVAQFIFGFVSRYNAYLGPMLYLEDKVEFYTLQVVLSQVTSIFPREQDNVYCATAILGMLPLILVYCFSQRLFIEGVAVGSVKG